MPTRDGTSRDLCRLSSARQPLTRNSIYAQGLHFDANLGNGVRIARLDQLGIVSALRQRGRSAIKDITSVLLISSISQSDITPYCKAPILIIMPHAQRATLMSSWHCRHIQLWTSTVRVVILKERDRDGIPAPIPSHIPHLPTTMEANYPTDHKSTGKNPAKQPNKLHNQAPIHRPAKFEHPG